MKKRNLPYTMAVILLLLFTLGPVLWCLIVALSPEQEILQQGQLFPEHFTLSHFEKILSRGTSEHETVFQGLKASLVAAGLTIAIGVPSAITAGYALVRYRFFGRKVLTYGILLTIVIPVFTTIIPVYGMFRNLGLIDNMFWTAIIITSSVLPINIWIVMNGVRELPEELWQAAAIDGFSERETFYKIILPLLRPTVLTVILMMFIMAWKQYVVPMILLTSPTKRLITMVLSDFMTRDMAYYGLIAAAGIMAILPAGILAVVFRRFFATGLTSGSVK